MRVVSQHRSPSLYPRPGRLGAQVIGCDTLDLGRIAPGTAMPDPEDWSTP